MMELPLVPLVVEAFNTDLQKITIKREHSVLLATAII